VSDAGPREDGPVTAFAFCGGAGLGAVQVGMLRALLERGIRPDVVSGTSSGSLNALVFAADPSLATVDRLDRLWMAARRRDLFRLNPWTVGRGLVGGSAHLASNARLRRMLASSLPVRRLEDTDVPVAIALTDPIARRPVVMRSGRALDVLLASSAVPGLFPPVVIDGRPYIDGGLVADPPIAAAVELGATRVYILPVGWPITEPHGGSAILRIADAVDWLCWRVADFEVERWSRECQIEIVPSPSTRQITPFDLRATRRLIDESYALASAWLDLPEAERAMLPPPPRGLPRERIVTRIAAGGRDVWTRMRRGA
jgi:NTE family protein